MEEFGRLDVLVNNAAFQNSQSGLEQLDEEQWDRTFKTNIYAYFHMAKAALPHLKEGSAIDYSTTKDAIHASTKSLAQNLVDRKIRVNCVAPGPVWTSLNPSDNKTPKEVAHFGEDVSMERPEEIAPAYVFLASDVDSSYIMGEVLRLLGGETTAG